MKNMQNDRYQSHLRMAWVIYALITLALIVVLVLFVALLSFPRRPEKDPAP